MAQQTINVGTSPNDGTGTPLRTAFQYTNSNFSELYTAVGPSGNNIVVPGTATITGDLTVDTSTLKVDSTNNRVGINTASPAAGAALSVVGTTSVSASNFTAASTWASRFEAAANNQPSGIFLSGLTSGGIVVPGSLHVEPVAASSRSALIATYAADSGVGYFAINRFSPSAGTTSQHFKIADDGVATWSNVGGVAGTAMTLNSTGLGIGATPAERLTINSSSAANYIKLTNSGAATGFLIGSFNTTVDIRNKEAGAMNFFTSDVQRMQIDSSGNVGIGVTPAGTGGCLQLKSGITFPAAQSASTDANTLDDYEEGTWTGTIGGTTGNPTTPVTATGRYTKIGRQVYVEIGFYGDTTGASSRITVSGLPFTSNASIARPGTILMDTMGTFTGSPIAFLGSGVTTIELYSSNSNGPISSVTHNAGAGRALYMELTYTV